MRMWYLSLALAGAFAVANGASAQVIEVQVQEAGQAQAGKVIKVQVQQGIQVQAAPAVQAIQVQADRAIGGPGAPAVFQPNRLSQADAILVGRVVAIEPMDVEATPAPGQGKVKYRVAVIQVTENIFGLKKDTQTVRVGFIAQGNVAPGGIGVGGGGVQILPAVQPGQIEIQPFPGRRPFPGNFQIQLAVGQDGMFTLNKHHKENFYLSPAGNNYLPRQNNPNFDNEVKNAKQLAKVMANPAASLKAEDKQDRYAAAALLINKYRQPNNPTGQPMKLEPIDADESKLILKALGEGDWTPGRFNARIPNPYELFNQLGINQKDGYNPVNIRTQQDIATAMQKWLDENNGKYRISKLVVDTNAKPGQPGVIQPGGDPKPGVVQPGVIRPGIRPLPPVRIQPVPPVQDLPANPAKNEDK